MPEKAEDKDTSTGTGSHSRDSKAINALITAMVVAVIGLVADNYLQKRAEEEARVRIYNQLVSEREKAESQLRSQMFSQIISSFVTTGQAADPEYQVLNLELLVHNFHESLNVAPLFYHVKRQTESAGEEREELAARLSDLAREVSRKQLLALMPHGDMKEMFFQFEKPMGEAAANIVVTSRETDTSYHDGNDLNSDPLFISDFDLRLARDEQERKLTVRVFLQDIEPVDQRVKIRLEIEDKLLKGQNPPEFWLDYFDFPMIDNTRLSGGYRLAVTLTDFDAKTSFDKKQESDIVKGAARIAVVAFPEEYASLKDRAFLQDLLKDLMPQTN